MFEAIIPILVGFFLIGEPIMIFANTKRPSAKHAAKMEQKTLSIEEKAQEHYRKFQAGELNEEKAEEIEKKEIIQAKGFADQLSALLKSEANYEHQMSTYLASSSNTTEYPKKHEFVRFFTRENELVDSIKNSLVPARQIAYRVKRRSTNEYHEIRHDLHSFLVNEKEAKFEHALSKEEVDLLKKEFGELAKEERTLIDVSKDESKIVDLIIETVKKLTAMKADNIYDERALKEKTKSPEDVGKQNKKILDILSKKQIILREIIISLDRIFQYINKISKEE